MVSSPDVSIIIPVYTIDEEVSNHFTQCYALVREHTPNAQIIVVHNGGPFMSFGWYPPAIYTYKHEPIGFARALNLGIALADCHYIALVSADVYVGPNWFDTLVHDLDAWGPGVVMPSDVPGRAGIEMNTVWGASWLTTREVIRDVGYHDEALLHRFSDQDWWIRMHKAGYKVFRSNNVPVKHYEGSTVNKMPERELWPAERARMIQKHGVAHYFEWFAKQ